MEWLILLVMLGAGFGPGTLVRRRGGSWVRTWLATFLAQAVVAAFLMVYLLVAHPNLTMPNTPVGILSYGLPHLLILSLMSAAPILALVRPVADCERQ